MLRQWGCPQAFDRAMSDSASIFGKSLDSHKESAPFDDFAHWLLGHCLELFDAGDDRDKAEAQKLLESAAMIANGRIEPHTSGTTKTNRAGGVPKIPRQKSPAVAATKKGLALEEQSG